MRYQLLLVLCMLLSGSSLFSQSEIRVNTGAVLKINGAIYINAHEMSINNDGNIEPGTISKVTVVSTNTPSDVTIGGDSITTFNQLEFNVSDKILLEQDIKIDSLLIATNGLLDMNGQIITLVDEARLTGESADDGITGPDGGSIQTAVALDAPNNYKPGNMGLVLTSTANLGPTTFERGHRMPTSSITGGYGIERYFDISPTNNDGLNATLRFCYRDDELGDIPEGELVLFRSTDGGNTWTAEGFTTRNATENWVELTGINGFSQWTLGSLSSSSLPVTLSYFDGECTVQGVQLHWVTSSEVKNDYFEVQHSVNGRDWQILGQVDGAGTTTTAQYYSYTDREFASTDNLYRLRQVDLDGTVTFSEVIHMDCLSFDDAPIAIFPNPATDKVVVSLRELSNEVSFIRLSKETGEVIYEMATEPSQEFEQYEISLDGLPAGIYFVQVEVIGRPYNFKLIKIEE